MSGNGPFAGRTALVTGAGRGIGRALALQLAKEGAHLVLAARTAEQLNETAALIGQDDTVQIAVDLGQRSGVDAVLQQSPAVDIVINNAGTVAPLGPSAEVSAEEYAQAFSLNVLATMGLNFGFMEGAVRRGWGRIVNISSGVVGNPAGMIGGNAYVATKAAVEAHTLNLAAELEGTGVTVNGYRPGTVDTAMQTWIRAQDPEQIGAELHQRFVDYQQEGTLISAEASAAALLKLLHSEQTGQIWNVTDG